MRDDLNKQLCERERRGSWRRFGHVRHNKKFAVRDPENTPAREGMKFRASATSNEKEFNENLNPLLGQVRKAVGRPFDKFYSDLSKTFDKRSVINQHILGHLDDFLCRDLYFDRDGVLTRHGRYGAVDRPLTEYTSIEFYVDPIDGIIKRNRNFARGKWRRRERDAQAQAEIDAVHRTLPDGSVLHMINDVWFHYAVKDAPVGHYVYDKPSNKDLFKPSRWSKEVPWERLRDYERQHCGVKRLVGKDVLDVLTGERVFCEPGKPPVKYHATKRTASHKTLKHAGLVP